MASKSTLPSPAQNPVSHPRNIVPPVDFVAHGISPVIGANPPSLSNHGGTVLQSVQVVPIYWGAAWSTGANATLKTQLDGFFDFILTSELMDLLAEYGIPGKPIQHGSRLSSVSVANSEPGTATPTGRQVTDAQIRSALQGWINGHTVPATTANTLYFIYLPPNVTCVGPGGSGSSCTQFCGYHNAFGSQIYYAVIPFVNCGGCVFSGTFLDTLTEVSSHELCEAITDPSLNTWWDSNSGNEVGDICNRNTVRIGNYLVQTEWSNQQNACVFSPILTAAGATIDGYATDFNNQQHVNFIGVDGHVHELYYSNGWHHNNLTSLAGAPATALNSHIDGYATSFNNQQHVNFVGLDNHVHELFYDGSWKHNDLTAITGAPPTAPGSTVDGYQTDFNSQQHVNFMSADGHIHELFYDGSWKHNDLTAITNAPPAAPGRGIDGYETSFNHQQHVNFIGRDAHVHELVYDGAWHHNDLTAITGAPPTAPNSPIDGYATTFNSQQHVNFIGTDNHLHELVYDGSWHHNDLSALTGAPAAAPGGHVDGYQTTFNNQQHVNFLGADSHVHELVYTNKWTHNDLTALTGAPPVPAGSFLDGYQTAFNHQQHVNFVGADNHVHELYYDGAWHHNDLTAIT